MESLSIEGENFVRCAEQRMQKMSFDQLMNLIQVYQELHMVSQGNPLYYYICHALPYRPNIKMTQDQRRKFELKHKEIKNMLQLIRAQGKYTQSLNLKVKEKPINFNTMKKNNVYFQFFNKNEKYIRNLQLNTIIIMIQKHVKSFVKRIKILRIITHIIISKMISKVLLIQKHFNGYKLRKNFRTKFLLNFILHERNVKSNKIKEALFNYRNYLETKRQYLIKNILDTRMEKIKFIQNYYRMRLLNQTAKLILQKQKTCYEIFYHYFAKHLEIKIYYDNSLKSYKNFNYFLCPIRNVFVCYIDFNEIQPGKHFCQIIKDSFPIFDEKLPRAERNGHYYNIIDLQRPINNIMNSISGSLARFSNEETNTNSKNIEYESNFSNNNNDDDIINKPSSGKKFNYSYNNQYFENEDDLFMALKKNLTGKVSEFSSVD